MIKKFLKDQRGLTLIELLAVVVILGIISAIAIPSIGGLIDNSKKDAHVANANQLINSAKMATAGDPAAQPGTGAVYLSLNYLVTKGYLETVKDPDGGTYTADTATDVKTAATDLACYVKVSKNANGTFLYEVKLNNGTRGIWAYDGTLTRDSVTKPIAVSEPSAPGA